VPFRVLLEFSCLKEIRARSNIAAKKVKMTAEKSKRGALHETGKSEWAIFAEISGEN
jgi:hypothetical protein